MKKGEKKEERAEKSLLSIFTSSCDEGRKWERRIPLHSHMIRTRMLNSGTGRKKKDAEFTPHILLFFQTRIKGFFFLLLLPAVSLSLSLSRLPGGERNFIYGIAIKY